MIVVMLVSQPSAVWSTQKTTVLIPKAPPFHSQRDMSALERLDFKLIETFAKKFKLDIEYITTNETLNEIFGTERGYNEFIRSIQGL